MTRKSPDPLERLLYLLGILVGIFWAIDITLDSIPSIPDGVIPNLTPLMTALCTGLIGLAVVRSRRNGKDEDDG